MYNKNLTNASVLIKISTYMIYVSHVENIRFPKQKRTFPPRETYVSACGNVEKNHSFCELFPYSFKSSPHQPHYLPFQPLESIGFYVVIPKIFCKFEETLNPQYYGNIPLLADTGRIAAGIGTCRIFLPADETGKRRHSCHGTHRSVRAARSHVVPETAI